MVAGLRQTTAVQTSMRGIVRLGRLAAALGSSGYAPNGPMPGSYGEGSRAAWYAQNAPTQAMNPQPGNMQAVSGQNMNA